MKIESLIRRKKGTEVLLGDTVYHFVAGNDERHICEVKNAEHAAMLLAIPHGFRAVVDGRKKDADVVTEAINETVADSVQEKQPEASDDQEGDLLARAKSLGIKATRNWGTPRLKATIAEAEAALADAES